MVVVLSIAVIVLFVVVGLAFAGAVLDEWEAGAPQRQLERTMRESIRASLETKLAAEAQSEQFRRDVRAYIRSRRPRW